MNQFEILLYYKYTPVHRPQLFVDWHKELCKRLNLKGRILIAAEGINGTVEGSPEANAEYVKALISQDGKGGQDKYGNTLNSDGSFCYGIFSDVSFKKSIGDAYTLPTNTFAPAAAAIDGCATPSFNVPLVRSVVVPLVVGVGTPVTFLTLLSPLTNTK